jgi:acyl carrier protein
MNREDIRRAIGEAISKVAPEADLSILPADAVIREELDLDSMDFLNVITELHEKLHVDVPEADYGKMATLRSCVDYLSARLGVSS